MDAFDELEYIPSWSSGWPSCLLCGIMIRSAQHSGPLKSYQKAIGRQLKRNTDQDQVLVPVKNVEEHYLVNYPWLGGCTFRAIASDRNGRFHLTGICIADWRCSDLRDFAVVPKDSSMARIGARSGEIPVLPGSSCHDPAFTHFRLRGIRDAMPEQQTSPGTGYLLHAHCWVLLGRQICDPIQTKLETLDLKQLVHTARSMRVADKPSWIFRADRSPANPLVIPRIQNIIALAERAVKLTRKARTSAVQSIQESHPSHPMNGVPMDIALLIAEDICRPDCNSWEATNLRNLLSVFEWELPESFWRRRVNEDVFFELKEIRKSNTQVNWQLLRLELMQLHGYPLNYRTGLRVRIQVLQTLKELMSAYAKDKVEESSQNANP
ncbi:hypothetical protein N7481_009049 [Penicillium waksmanii]|uniref:uncharacterized protein n=1 Tax=Penicillium waksmanii TaxID=69791 RepID=UPI002549AB2E|nr:uncharacterized protein N7481_009049 [Penicillium waksmanii]KAJ5975342.1 hypothetical protein N7481_009049 [Penicillium waksmanii]